MNKKAVKIYEFSYRPCAIASKVINIGQHYHKNSIPLSQITLHTKFQVIWCISKDIMGMFNFWYTYKQMWGRAIYGALKSKARQLRNGFSSSAQNLDF